MHRMTIWTEGQDSQIRRFRTEGTSWDLIALALGLARWTVIERGRVIGAQGPSGNADTAEDELDRQPLPAGHAETWGAINRGTSLENLPFRTPESIR